MAIQIERPERTMDVLRMAGEMRLKPGKIVKVHYREMLNSGKFRLKGIRKGEVIAVYPFHFLVSFGNSRERFRWNELVGDEKVKVTV